MDLKANCRVRLRDSEGKIIFKANKQQLVPAWVIERDPSLRAKCDPPEEKLESPPPAESQPPEAADDGPGAAPVGASPSPQPVAAPKRRGRPKGSKSKSA